VPIEERITDLLSRMTLEERVAQLHEQQKEFEIRDGSVTPESLENTFKGMSHGCISGPFGARAQEILVHNRDAQEYALTKTRLGIPFLTVLETLHGGLSLGTTIYPQTIAQGSTWNPALIREMASTIASEIRACGVVQSLSPMSTLARDPRWGRVEECFGECPYLVSRFVVAYIEGMQGVNLSEEALPHNRMLCMSKVLAGYEMPRAGINIAGASVGEREMRSLYLVPHEAAVREAHVASLMPSYNSVDGIPAHANRWLLTTVLRDEWGFDGYLYADWGGVTFLHELHQVAATPADAALMAITAGMDLEAPSPANYQHLPQLVREGRVLIEMIDRSVARVLRTKFRAGLFDGGHKALAVEELDEHLHTPEMVALARRVAEESIILLKNDNGLLPLDPRDLERVAVIGPNADQVQFGDYSATKDNSAGVTVLEAVREQGKESGFEVTYARGCDWVGPDTSGFSKAVKTAGESDVALVVVGDTSMNIGGGMPGGQTDRSIGKLATVGEGYDRTDLTIPGLQEELVKAIHATGTPVVLVLVNGRPFSIPWMHGHIPAIVEAFYPGEEGGHAIADIIFGKVNPSGRLPLSVPQSVGHIPTVYDFEPADRGVYHKPGTLEEPGRDYVFSSPDPLWAFGYGLSFTTFDYSDLKIESPQVTATSGVSISFVVQNTGDREGREVAQVYYRDAYSSTVTPNRRLIRFQKVALRPGESRRLHFMIPAQELALWNARMERVVEPGIFNLMVGASAEDIRLMGQFRVGQ
jgi:beta-glucosidase